jgi:TonB family protein
MSYPKDEIEEEGWVQLGFMVDGTGKPFEVTVNSSSGNRVFERQAIAAIERSAFTPGLLNGQPIDSATQIKVVFQFATPSTGPGLNSFRNIQGSKRPFAPRIEPPQMPR